VHIVIVAALHVGWHIKRGIIRTLLVVLSRLESLKIFEVHIGGPSVEVDVVKGGRRRIAISGNFGIISGKSSTRRDTRLP